MSLYSGTPFLSGQTLWLTLDFVGRKEIDRVSTLTLVDLNGTDLETFNITQGQGYYKNFYFVTFVPSAETFRLKVTGIDKTRTRFQRVKPTLFTLGEQLRFTTHISNYEEATKDLDPAKTWNIGMDDPNVTLAFERELRKSREELNLPSLLYLHFFIAYRARIT